MVKKAVDKIKEQEIKKIDDIPISNFLRTIHKDIKCLICEKKTSALHYCFVCKNRGVYYCEKCFIAHYYTHSEEERDKFNKKINIGLEFENWRIYGDERDFNEIKVEQTHKEHSELKCTLHKKIIDLAPDLASNLALDLASDLALDPNNKVKLCVYCVQDYIRAFMEYRKDHNLPFPED